MKFLLLHLQMSLLTYLLTSSSCLTRCHVTCHGDDVKDVTVTSFLVKQLPLGHPDINPCYRLLNI